MGKTETWALDVSHWPETYCWCPFDPETGGLKTGLNIIADKPPHGGTVVAAFHTGGAEAMDAFDLAHGVEVREFIAKINKEAEHGQTNNPHQRGDA